MAAANDATIAVQAIDNVPDAAPHKGLRFYLILLALCLSLFCSALEFTGLSTALPVIVNELHGADFAWVGTAYAIAATALLPLTGGLAEIFGRKITMLLTLALFALGSALCGAAKSMNWLIGARVVQGLGGGGLLSVPSIIISDMVPLHERAFIQSIFGVTWAFASAIGPLVAGTLAEHGQWRWFFYMNLPLSGLAFSAVVIFVQSPTPPGSLREKLARVDWIGNFIVVASTTSTVIGLTWGGVNFPWSSAQTLVPLILGLAGLVVFFLYEIYVAKEPLVPFAILKNMTSMSGYLQTFFHAIIMLSVIYYLAAYYQACKDASPIRSAVLMLSMALVTSPTVILSTISIRVTEHYRPQTWFGWAAYVAGAASLIAVHADSNLALPVGLCAFVSFGCGVIYGNVYYIILAPLDVSQNAYAISFLNFCRTFSGVWGIAIGGAVLQNELRHRLPQSFLESIAEAGTPSSVELAYSVIPLIKTLPEPLKHEVRNAFGASVSRIWIVMAAIGALGLVSSLFMKNVPMQKPLDPKWNMEQKNGSHEVAIEAGMKAHFEKGQSRPSTAGQSS